MPKVPSAGRELTRRLSSRNPTTTQKESKNGFLQVNTAATSKRPVPPFSVLSALRLRILKDGEDPVTLASVSEAIVEKSHRSSVHTGPFTLSQPIELIRAETGDL
ncbi:hypothetical protein PIB30_060354 [Stylosanthes scabra]|uniref:Uncharacterized protein n=1 Tax=Stylosanthes scabra TaxID=79078 RepID=A0ABU6QJZ6_9FABA|nr:hypothetical protein [Stylosanthes scabra]